MNFVKSICLGLLALLATALPAFSQARSGATSSLDADVGAVTFRCALWQRAGMNIPALYIKDGNDYKMIQLFEMMFQREYKYRGALPIGIYRKATEAEKEQRKAQGIKKSEQEYVPLFAINPRGMKDVGVILLPGKLENKPEKEILVFDWSEKAFPYGTIRIANFSRRGLMGQLTPQGEKKGETFKLKHGAFFSSEKLTAKRKIYELQLAALVNKQPQVIYSSAASFYGDARTMIFIIPDSKTKTLPDEAPKLEFRSIRDRKREVPESDSKKKPSSQGRGE